MTKVKEVPKKEIKKEEPKKKEVAQKVDNTINIIAWFSVRAIRRHEWKPRKVYASKHQMVVACLEVWDKFFEKY